MGLLKHETLTLGAADSVGYEKYIHTDHHTIGGTGSLDIVRSATLVVAANDALARFRAEADYTCDGTADNVEIQAALDALPAAGGCVVLSEGLFTVAAQITLPANAMLVGQGMGATIIRAVNSWGASVYPLYVNGNNAIIAHLEVDCNSANQTGETICVRDAGVSISGTYLYKVSLKNCYTGTWPRATNFQGADTTVAYCKVTECDYGIVIPAGSIRAKVIGNYVLLRAGAPGNCLYMRTPKDAIVCDNLFDGNKTLGECVDIHNFTNLVVANNVVRYAGDDGISIAQIDEGYVANAEMARHFVCSGNVVYGCGARGIDVGEAVGTNRIKHGTVIGNTVFNNQEGQDTAMAGIALSGGVQEVMVVGNRCFDDHADVQSSLTANGLTGATSITVGDGSLFHVNEYVTISDGNSPDQDLLISAISGNVLTVTALTADYTTAQNAKVTGKDTQLWGIRESGTNNANNLIANNDVRNSTTAGVAWNGTGTVVKDNLGYNTEGQIEHHTSDDTLTIAENGSVHTNLGAGGAVALTLPQSGVPSGFWIEFVVMAAQQLRIDPGAAGAIYINGAKQTDDKYIWADDEGESVKLIADGNGDWVALGAIGTWGVEV